MTFEEGVSLKGDSFIIVEDVSSISISLDHCEVATINNTVRRTVNTVVSHTPFAVQHSARMRHFPADNIAWLRRVRSRERIRCEIENFRASKRRLRPHSLLSPRIHVDSFEI